MAAFLEENGELLQQISLFLTLQKIEGAEKLYKGVVGARLLYEFHKKMAPKQDTEIHRIAAILAIADFVKKHPKASEDQILKEVQKQIDLFVDKIK